MNSFNKDDDKINQIPIGKDKRLINYFKGAIVNRFLYFYNYSILVKSFLISHNTKFLALFSAFSVLLIFIRMFVVENDTFLFLIKNLGLAWISYLLSHFFYLQSKILKNGIGLLALLFFPNTLYMVTDLFQLWPKNHISVWFELIHLLSFAITSLFLGFGTLQNFEKYFLKRFKKRTVNVSIFLIIYLGSFGVYFGRFVRLNSSDVFLRPKFLVAELVEIISHPFDDVNFYGTTFLFALLCYFLYYGIYNFAKNHK